MSTENRSMNEMMAGLEKTMKRIRVGDILEGEVISVNDKEAIINIGYMSDGIISKGEITRDADASPKDVLTEGQKLPVYVLKLDDGEGNVILSKLLAEKVKAKEEIKQMFENGDVFTVTVQEAVKGGVVTRVNGERAFIPASRLSVNFVQDLNAYVGKDLEVKIIELDESKGKVVLSHKEIEAAEVAKKKEKLWAQLKPGQKVEGVVRKITNYGAFVDIGGMDGLVHISDMSWDKIKHPSEVVSEGDKVEVYVGEVDREKERISLSLKDVSQDPWKVAAEAMSVGNVVEGKVTKLLQFGAIVSVAKGVEGLVHISEMSNEHVSKPSDIVKVGDSVKVKVLDIDTDKKKVSLSIKATIENEEDSYVGSSAGVAFDDEEDNGLTLGDALGAKLKGLKLD